MEELAGFVNGNVNRRKILEILESKGATNAGKISKVARIIPPMTDKILEELLSYHLVQKDGDQYTLTTEGKAVVDFIRAL